MASIFKRKRRVKLASGKTIVRKSKCWYIEYQDKDGMTRRVRGYVDKAATKQKSARLERDAAQANEGLIDKYAKHKKRPLSEHLEDFKKWLETTRAKKTKQYRSKTHVRITVSRIKKIIEGCGFIYWSDIDPDKTENFLNELDVGINTYDYYFTAIRQFCNWMVTKKRADKSPLDELDRVGQDKNENRRGLMFDEVFRLLATTEKAPTRFGMTGHERAVVYLLAIETGLRVRELQSLKVKSFDFKNCKVTVEAGFCKNKQQANQWLKQRRASQLKQFLAGKLPDATAFNMPSSFRTAKMLHADLKVANIPIVDDAGQKIVFHSLRHTLANGLDSSGASLKERMDIMRHSDKSNLTLGTYTDRPKIYNLKQAIENLPEYPWPGTQKNKAVLTGTDSRACSIDQPLTGKRTGKWTGTAYPDSISMSSNGTTKSRKEHLSASIVETSKPLKVDCLETKKDRLSPPDNGKKLNGPGRIRTFDQWIMSPLL